jgi:hypothetical protein
MATTPTPTTLRMFGAPTAAEPLDWSSVEDRLAGAEMYWVIGRGDGHPHPRPVWGVWREQALHLSLGSPALNRLLAADPTVTVHLGDAIDVVIVEGRLDGHTGDDAVIAAYDRKYRWTYDLDAYGAFAVIRPSTVLAWRAAGAAGRDGFVAAGRWTFE